MRTALLVVVLLVAGCGTQAAPAQRGPIAPAEWKAVLNDWYPDGVVDHPHPCAAILIAIQRLPADPAAYSTIDRDLRRALRRFCPRSSDLGALRVGMSDADVAARAGLPGRVLLHCWLYRVTRDHPGRRVCFARGRVTTLQYSVHG